MNRRRRFKAKRRRQLIARLADEMCIGYARAKQHLAAREEGINRERRDAKALERPLMWGRIGKGSTDAISNYDGSVTLTVRRPTFDAHRAQRQLERLLPKADIYGQ